jgi:ABC-type spermidine/putrescine transport system permease subunit I
MMDHASSHRPSYIAWGGVALLLLVLIVGSPIAMTAWQSLRDPAGTTLNGQAWTTIAISREATYALAYSLVMGAAVAVISTFCSLPVAYLIGIRAGVLSRWLMALVIVLWLLDPGIRILGWMQIIKSGVSVNLLPDAIQGSAASELAARVHGWLPLTILLQALAFGSASKPQLAAAQECGAGAWRIFRSVLWPESRRWVLLAASLVFCGATGGFLEPRLLGSGHFEQATEWLQRAMESEVGWPYASSMLLLLLALSLLPAILLLNARWRQ